MSKKSTSPISDLQRAKSKAQAGWDAMRQAKRNGASVKECVSIVKSASKDWDEKTNHRPLNIKY